MIEGAGAGQDDSMVRRMVEEQNARKQETRNEEQKQMQAERQEEAARTRESRNQVDETA